VSALGSGWGGAERWIVAGGFAFDDLASAGTAEIVKRLGEEEDDSPPFFQDVSEKANETMEPKFQ
jgi:hypothetical protein